MRGIRFALVLGLLGGAPALAEDLRIDQNATSNYSFVTIVHPDSSDIRIDQQGRKNVISAAQLAPDLNQIAATQSGWVNTSVLYQDGFIDIAWVTQSGPDAPLPETRRPTAYSVQETDQGFLSTFTSGELSIVTLTSPGTTYVSHFGRRH